MTGSNSKLWLCARRAKLMIIPCFRVYEQAYFLVYQLGYYPLRASKEKQPGAGEGNELMRCLALCLG